MFKNFERKFKRDDLGSAAPSRTDNLPATKGLRDFFVKLGGASYSGGLYRTVHSTEVDMWNQRIWGAFPQYASVTLCFGYDWLGSLFAIDFGRSVDGEPGVLMFEPGTGEVLEIPASIITFHDEELLDLEFSEAALIRSFFEKWVHSGGAIPARSQCVGYKKPLFLGGRDEIDNLELTDIDVYWHLIGQLIRQTQGLPEGTQVNLKLD
jgi:hypothetical protein